MNRLRQLRKFWHLDESNWVVVILIANLILFALSLVLSQFWSQGQPLPSAEALYLLGSNQPHLILDGQWYRLITANFLHGGVLHILFNSYFLWRLGPYAQAVLGGRRFLAMYLFTGITGAAVSAGWRLYEFSDVAPWMLPGAIGASTSMFGILGFLLLWAKRTPGAGDIGNQLMVCLFINLALGFSIEVIDNAGHIGGLLGGLLYAYGFTSRRADLLTRGLMSTAFARALLTLVLIAFLMVPVSFFGEFGTTCRRLYTLRPYVGEVEGVFEADRSDYKASASDVAELRKEWGDDFPFDLEPLEARLRAKADGRGGDGWAVTPTTIARRAAWQQFMTNYWAYLGYTGFVRIQG